MVLMVEMNFGAAFLGGFGRHSQPGCPLESLGKSPPCIPDPFHVRSSIRKTRLQLCGGSEGQDIVAIF